MEKSRFPTQLSKKFSIEEAHLMQLRLSRLVIREDMIPERIDHVGGVDVTYTDKLSIGAAVVLDYRNLSVVESRRARIKTRFPYIPTLFSFREIPPTLAVIRKIGTQPDVFLIDGQGIAHPYRLGFASHLGLILDKPTIGVAKSLLIGEIDAVNKEGWAPIIDNGEVIGGAVVRQDKKPIYVSIGHKVSLERAVTIVRHCITSHRIPEPLRLAHNLATEEKTKYRLNL